MAMVKMISLMFHVSGLIFDEYRDTNKFDGKYKGADLPDGTYYYILKYTNTRGLAIDRAGFVVIHRK